MPAKDRRASGTRQTRTGGQPNAPIRGPSIEAPLPDAPWLPVMEMLNDVHAASTADEPPMRDRD